MIEKHERHALMDRIVVVENTSDRLRAGAVCGPAETPRATSTPATRSRRSQRLATRACVLPAILRHESQAVSALRSAFAPS